MVRSPPVPFENRIVWMNTLKYLPLVKEKLSLQHYRGKIQSDILEKFIRWSLRFTRWFLGSLPTQNILWFYEKMAPALPFSPLTGAEERHRDIVLFAWRKLNTSDYLPYLSANRKMQILSVKLILSHFLHHPAHSAAPASCRSTEVTRWDLL